MANLTLKIHTIDGLFRNKCHISSARLQNWDYRWAAAYFVTICTHDRVHYFGDVIDGKMVLSELGTIAERYWADIINNPRNWG